MTPNQTATARACHAAADQGSMDFPQILATLAGAGFEGYLVDYRQGESRYYQPDGESVDCPGHAQAVALAFDAAIVAAAIRDAQAKAPGYSYRGFSAKVAAAGCAGYLVSLPGRRVVYFGRTGEVHTEHFPTAK